MAKINCGLCHFQLLYIIENRKCNQWCETTASVVPKILVGSKQLCESFDLSLVPYDRNVMVLKYNEPQTEGVFVIVEKEANLYRDSFRNEGPALLTIAWNTGEDQQVWIDEIAYTFPHNTVLALMVNDTFHFEKAADIIAWQFNREFYCIADHDHEVSCVGFLFYGCKDELFIELDNIFAAKIDLLHTVFKDEFNEQDNIQGEMLRMLLKRLIIIVTRLAKQQHLTEELQTNKSYDIVRKYNLLVEQNFRKLRQVQDYANLLHKSPKTLSNLFLSYNQKSPLQIILDRVTLEAKRLLYYTDKSAKEIAFDLGYNDPAQFSKFFKKQTGYSPLLFKENLTKNISGKN